MFILIKYKWYRKWKGGTYYLIRNDIIMNPFWSATLITNCGGVILETEIYPTKEERTKTKILNKIEAKL